MERKITVTVFVWVLGNLCRWHRIPFEAGLLLQQFPSASPDGYDVAELLAAADRLDLQFGENRVSTLLAAPDHVFPCLAFLQPDSSAGLQPVLIARSPQGALACCAPGADEPRDIDLSASAPTVLPTAYSFFAKPEAAKDEDGKPIAEHISSMATVKSLQMDKVFSFGTHHQAMKMEMVEDERRRGSEETAEAKAGGNAD